MRINAPQLFNGEILASQKWIADQLSGLFPSGGYIPSAEVFNIGDVLNSDMIIKSVYGDTIKIDSTDAAQTIKEYISTVSGDLYNQITTGVKLVEGRGLTRTSAGIEVVPSDFISFTKEDTAISGFAATYTMTIDGKETKINIPKDQFLKDAKFVLNAQDVNAVSGYTDYPAIKFVFDVSSDGVDGIDTVVWVPVKDLFQEFTDGDGLTLTGTEFSIVADSADDTANYLVIGKDTIGLKGITEAISGAAEAISGAAFAYTDIASGALLGTADDTDAANTIYGAKAYADKVAGEAEAAANVAANGALTTFITGTYDPFVADTNADIDIISGVIGKNYANESTIDDRLTAVETTVGIGSGTGSLTDRMTKAEADIDALEGRMTDAEANITDTRGRAVELKEVSVNFGGITAETMTSAIITGRVIAVFDATDTQCYPTITYNAGVSTLTAITSGGVENFTVVYSKVISSEIFN